MNYKINLNSPLLILKNEWKIILPALVVFFFLANILIFGWAFWYWPNSISPLLYEGDGLAFLYNFKRLTEDTWYFTNNRVNYPWLSYFHDFPQSDVGNYLFIKLVSAALGSYVIASNLYLSLGFPLVFFAGYVLFRVLNISKINSFLGAFAYAFLAFHFLRSHHIFFTWYFVVPAYVYMYFQLIFREHLLFTAWKTNSASNIRHLIALIILPFFGGYYALFALFGFVFCIFLVIANRRKFWLSVYAGFVSCGAILLGTILNIWPTLLYNYKNGPNLEALIRVPLESELYAFKFSQLLIPVGYYPVLWVRQLADFFNYNSSTINENASATIGLVASIGVIFSLSLMVYQAVFKNPKNESLFNNKVLLASGLFILFFVLFASIGGLVSLYALLINSTARGWNRVSIYIALFGLISFFTLIDYWYKTKFYKHKKLVLISITSFFLGIFIVVDQTPLRLVTHKNIDDTRYLENEKFYSDIEKSLPVGAAIFQLPYQIYPGHPKGNMGAYSHLEGPLHTQNLRWSSGGLAWREGEWFYRFLDELPLIQQLEVASAMGFSGIYIDKRAFCDNGQWIEDQVTDYIRNRLPSEQNKIELGFIRNEGQGRVYVPLPKSANMAEQKKVANHYLKQIGFSIEEGLIPVSKGQINGVIDFRRESLPYYVKFVNGLSRRSFALSNSKDAQFDPYNRAWKLNAAEGPACYQDELDAKVSKNEVPVGRWSDARLHKTVQITFDRPLPQKFRLTISASAVGPNVGAPTVIKVGNVTRTINLSYEMQKHQIDFEVPPHSKLMEIIPYKPVDVSLETRDVGSKDRRLLALHLQSMTFEKLH
jgi:phosphoglycerol transferase